MTQNLVATMANKFILTDDLKDKFSIAASDSAEISLETFSGKFICNRSELTDQNFAFS